PVRVERVKRSPEDGVGGGSSAQADATRDNVRRASTAQRIADRFIGASRCPSCLSLQSSAMMIAGLVVTTRLMPRTVAGIWKIGGKFSEILRAVRLFVGNRALKPMPHSCVGFCET